MQFEKEVKPQSDLYHRSPVKTSREALQHTALNKLHSKVAEVENENTSVEAAHQTEQKAESLARYSVRTAKYIDGQRKAAPYKKAARLKVKAEKAEIKAAYEKTLAENPSLKKSALKKFRQKQQIKKKYQKAKRAEQTAKQAKKAAQNAERAASRLAAFIWRHKAVFGVILAIVLLIAWLGTALSSCSVIGTTGFNSIMVSSYFAEDEDIYAAENYYNGLEQNLQSKMIISKMSIRDMMNITTTWRVSVITRMSLFHILRLYIRISNSMTLNLLLILCSMHNTICRLPKQAGSRQTRTGTNTPIKFSMLRL